MSKNTLKIVLVLILLIALIAAGVYWWQESTNYTWSKPKDDPISQLVRFKKDGTPDVHYAVSKVLDGYNQNNTATGTLEERVQAIQAANQKPLIETKAANIKPSMQFALKDLTIKSDAEVNLQQYGTDLGTVFKPYGEASLEYVPAMALAAMQSKDPADIEPLTIIKISMVQRAGKMLKMNVPDSAKNIHLSTINSLLFLAELIYNMEQVGKEPILALESGTRYTTEYFKLLAELNQFNYYFAAKGITFSADQQTKFSVPLTTASTTP